MDREYDILGGYLPSFVQHLQDTRTRLGLWLGSRENEDWTGTGNATEESTDSEAQAHTGWTPSEHDAFFRALSVHSRWRPDLIAACVPTKTEWEVWMYLEALEEGATMLTMQQGDEDAVMEEGHANEVEMQLDSDSHSHSGPGVDSDEDLCEPALEVSQAWIDAEESMASWIIDEEHLTSFQEVNAAPATEAVDVKPPKRKRGRPLGSGKRRARSKVRRQNVSNHGSPSPDHCSASPGPTSTCKASQDSSTLLARKRGALMGRLEVAHLQVLDSILREDEEAMKDKSKSREGSVVTVASTEHGDDANVSSLSSRITGLSGTGNIRESSPDVVIDPALWTISGAADPAGQVASETTSTCCTFVHDPIPIQSTPPDASPQPGPSNVFMFPEDNAILAYQGPPGPGEDAESELSLLSPRSRRRVQKRLYMRRKRASLRGDGTVWEGIEKLKPGKKAKPGQSETSVVSLSTPYPDVPSDAEAEPPEDVPKKNKPGLTLPYKLKAQFAELGIDAAYLRNQGMDLLNLGALGRLMGLCSSLEHGEEGDGSVIAESIDAQLIRRMQASMVSFVTDIIHRAIVWRERETRLKQRSRAWRHGDQITVGAVEHAVDVVGARHRSHKAYFKSLEASYGLIPHVSASTVESDPLHASTGLDAVPVDPPQLSLHRDVYTPLVRPPSAWKIGPLASLTRTYEREATRTRRGMSAEIEEELMSDETDEEALEAELEEEEKVDVLDTTVASTYERDLWKIIYI